MAHDDGDLELLLVVQEADEAGVGDDPEHDGLEDELQVVAPLLVAVYLRQDQLLFSLIQ